MTAEELKALMDKIALATKAQIGELTTAQKAELEAVKSELTTKLGTQLAENQEMKTLVKNLEIQLSEAKVAMNRSDLNGDKTHEHDVKTSPEYKKAFNDFMRKGANIARDLVEKEYKELSVMIDVDGGFLVTPEMSGEIVKKVFESSPMRELSSAVTISSDSLNILQDNDEADAGWVGEKQSRAGTDSPELALINIPVHEMYAKPRSTQKLLDDAMFNVESWLQEKVSSKFARLENAAFINGNGVLKPKGILSYAEETVAETFTLGKLYTATSTGTGVTFTADDVLDLIAEFKDEYLAGLVIQIHRSALKIMRKFKDTQGQYLWSPGLNGLRDSTFAGIPVRLSQDLETFAASSKSLVIGDFKQGYQIVDRFGVRVVRDIYSAKPYVEFYSTKRVGGGVKNFEAIKVLKTKAS